MWLFWNPQIEVGVEVFMVREKSCEGNFRKKSNQSHVTLICVDLGNNNYSREKYLGGIYFITNLIMVSDLEFNPHRKVFLLH